MATGLVFYNKQGISYAKDMNELIKENVIRILMTNRYERVNNPLFGCDLRRYLFEPERAMEDLGTAINTAIKQYEPRAILTELSITKDGESNEKFNINIKVRGMENNTISLTI